VRTFGNVRPWRNCARGLNKTRFFLRKKRFAGLREPALIFRSKFGFLGAALCARSATCAPGGIARVVLQNAAALWK